MYLVQIGAPVTHNIIASNHATPDYRGAVLRRNDDDCILVVKFFFKHSFGKKLFFFQYRKIGFIWKLS